MVQPFIFWSTPLNSSIVSTHHIREACGDCVVLNDPREPTYHSISNEGHDCLDWAIATGAAAPLLQRCEIGPDLGFDHLSLVMGRFEHQRCLRNMSPVKVVMQSSAVKSAQSATPSTTHNP